jgi:hypothetical protein
MSILPYLKEHEMNNDDLDDDGESPLESWENFLRMYCQNYQLSYPEVLANTVLIEQLNVLWLRSRQKSPPTGTT